MRSPGNNRLQGAALEDLFLREAKYRGLYARKSPIAARYGWKGRLVPLKSDLDFTLIDPRTGRVGYFDCKSFSADHFTHSDIDPHQVEQSVLLNELTVPSGFVVWFLPSNAVSFYTGTEIAEGGYGARFTPDLGLSIGTGWDFDLRLIMPPSAASKHKPKKKCKKINQVQVSLVHNQLYTTR